jgi:hypothetical protein
MAQERLSTEVLKHCKDTFLNKQNLVTPELIAQWKQIFENSSTGSLYNKLGAEIMREQNTLIRTLTNA